MHTSHVHAHAHTTYYITYLKTDFMLQHVCCTVSNWLNDTFFILEPIPLSLTSQRPII